MRKTIIMAVAAAFLASTGLQAADFGFALRDEAGFTGNTAAGVADFADSLRLSGYVAFRIGSSVRVGASGWAGMDFVPADESEPAAFDGNLESLGLIVSLLPANSSASLSLAAGRIRRIDPLPFVGLKRFDGLALSASKGQFDLTVEAGYLGLLSGKNDVVLLSADDYLDYADSAVYFGSPRVYAGARARFVELIAGQDVLLGMAAQFDVRGDGALQTVHGQYIDVGAEGAIGRGFSHSIGASLVNLQRNPNPLFDAPVAMSASAVLSYAAPAALDSKFELGLLWGSGRENGLSPFAPLASEAIGSSWEGYLQSILRIKAGYALAPLAGMSISLSISGFARSGDVPPYDPDYLVASGEDWLGEELALSASYAPWSDFSAGLSGSCFLPARGLSYADDAGIRWKAGASVTVKW